LRQQKGGFAAARMVRPVDDDDGGVDILARLQPAIEQPRRPLG
jgi:hypothetical protein